MPLCSLKTGKANEILGMDVRPTAVVRHGAASENRTPDNLITSEVLYRLS